MVLLQGSDADDRHWIQHFRGEHAPLQEESILGLDAGEVLMENPATWGEAEKVVRKALNEAHEARLQMICGLSTEKRITNALRAAGLLIDEEKNDNNDTNVV